MKILGIETSCDETAAAVVEDGTKILSSTIASSSEMHIKTGGIIPEQAARQQVKSIIPVIQQALVEAVNEKVKTRKQPLSSGHHSFISESNIDAIAVTVGPGLIGSLLVGVETAKTLSYLWKKPIVPVNHLVGHVYANFISEKSKLPEKLRNGTGKSQKPTLPKFPALALVASGGHTDLVFMKSHGKIKWIGGTRDDAAGEAFDKTARLLKLPYPGGPAISAVAKKFLDQSSATSHQSLTMFPRPMINDDGFDWSFSGLKTSVLRSVQKTPDLQHRISEFSANIQEAIVDVLVTKTLRAVKKYKPRSLLLAGGVTANKRLRQRFKHEISNLKSDTNIFIPAPKLCTDNATFIASAAFFNYSTIDWKRISVNPQLTIASETQFKTRNSNGEA